MIKCYTWTTPNGYKIPIMLEEAGIPYELELVNIGADEQHTDEYRKINPNGKIPAIIDTDGPEGKEVTIFESGAILWYLAKKAGKFIPEGAQEENETLSWLFMQVGSVGPMMGQLGHFKRADEKIPYAINRYMMETERLLGVLNTQLEGREYLIGEYSVADMAMWPWVRLVPDSEISIEMFPSVAEWIERVGEREAVGKALERLDQEQLEK